MLMLTRSYFVLGLVLLSLNTWARPLHSKAEDLQPFATAQPAPYLEEDTGPVPWPSLIPDPIKPSAILPSVGPSVKPSSVLPSPSLPSAKLNEQNPVLRPQLPNDWDMPVKGPITNAFGNSYRYYGIYRSGHTGIDIAVPRGRPVYAPTAGKVVKVWLHPNQRYGSYIVLQHAPDLFSLYAHLQQVNVRVGQNLKKGAPLAQVGITGAAGYPHLHFEVLNQLPRGDGAWGYLGICQKANEAGPGFINAYAYTIRSIRRQAQQKCQTRPLKQSLVYYNPELMWAPLGPLKLRKVSQPANEEQHR